MILMYRPLGAVQYVSWVCTCERPIPTVHTLHVADISLYLVHESQCLPAQILFGIWNLALLCVTTGAWLVIVNTHPIVVTGRPVFPDNRRAHTVAHELGLG